MLLACNLKLHTLKIKIKYVFNWYGEHHKIGTSLLPGVSFVNPKTGINENVTFSSLKNSGSVTEYTAHAYEQRIDNENQVNQIRLKLKSGQ